MDGGPRTGLTAHVDGVLAVGSVEETITVTGEVPVVDIVNAQQHVALDHDVIERGRGLSPAGGTPGRRSSASTKVTPSGRAGAGGPA